MNQLTQGASLVAQLVKNLPAMWETWVRSLGWEDPLEKGKATHSSILAWRIPWTVQSIGSQRVGHNFPFTIIQGLSVKLLARAVVASEGLTARLTHMSAGGVTFLVTCCTKNLSTLLAFGQEPPLFFAIQTSAQGLSQRGSWPPQSKQARETSKVLASCLSGLIVLYCQVFSTSKQTKRQNHCFIYFSQLGVV